MVVRRWKGKNGMGGGSRWAEGGGEMGEMDGNLPNGALRTMVSSSCEGRGGFYSGWRRACPWPMVATVVRARNAGEEGGPGQRHGQVGERGCGHDGEVVRRRPAPPIGRVWEAEGAKAGRRPGAAC